MPLLLRRIVGILVTLLFQAGAFPTTRLFPTQHPPSRSLLDPAQSPSYHSFSPGRSPLGVHSKDVETPPKQPSKRPRNYWTNMTNVDVELRELWASALQGALKSSTSAEVLPPHLPPPIPNQALLNYWHRHDLRAVISKYDSAHGLLEDLIEACYPGVTWRMEGPELEEFWCKGRPRIGLEESRAQPWILPGSWNEAVQTRILQATIAQDPHLSLDYPPPSPQQRQKLMQKASDGSPATNITNVPRWQQNPSRRPRGYWRSDRIVIEKLFEYLDARLASQNLPAVWMPRYGDIINDGHEDLAMALRRHGGISRIQYQAGMVPYKEWKYFEGLYELLVLLKAYLDEHPPPEVAEGQSAMKYRRFPTISDLRGHGHHRLYILIQRYGGQKFLAARLDMRRESRNKRTREASDDVLDMNWGPFDLEFGIDILKLVRILEIRKKPPLESQRRAVFLPPQQVLLFRLEELQDPYFTNEKGALMDKKIYEYGGYENVARRLGLAYYHH